MGPHSSKGAEGRATPSRPFGAFHVLLTAPGCHAPVDDEARTDEDLDRRRGDLFVVRVAGEQPGLAGRVEHVQTGEKYVFDGLEDLGRAMVRMGRRQREPGGLPESADG